MTGKPFNQPSQSLPDSLNKHFSLLSEEPQGIHN